MFSFSVDSYLRQMNSPFNMALCKPHLYCTWLLFLRRIVHPAGSCNRLKAPPLDMDSLSRAVGMLACWFSQTQSTEHAVV